MLTLSFKFIVYSKPKIWTKFRADYPDPFTPLVASHCNSGNGKEISGQPDSVGINTDSSNISLCLKILCALLQFFSGRHPKGTKQDLASWLFS